MLESLPLLGQLEENLSFDGAGRDYAVRYLLTVAMGIYMIHRANREIKK